METIDKFLHEINELKKAKRLLDDILFFYNIYENTFDNERIQKDDKQEKNFALKNKVQRDTLNDSIRAYIQFDDSE